MSSTMNHTASMTSTRADTEASGEPAAVGTTRIYRGASVEELIPRIQAELGGDAIVVHQNSGLTGGVGGFFQRPFVEIEARRGHPGVDLYDEPDGGAVMPPAVHAPIAPQATRPPQALAPQQAMAPPVYGHTGVVLRDTPTEPAPAPKTVFEPTLERAPRNGTHPSDLEQIDDEFAAVLAETEVASMPSEPRGGHDDELDDDSREYVERRRPPVAPSPSGRARKSVESSLLGVGFGEELVAELIEAAAAHARPLMPSRSGLARSVRTVLRQRIPSCPPLPTPGATIAFVGPGGSGRTSCCAAILKAYREHSTLPAACATVVAAESRDEYSMLLSPDIREPTPLSAPQLARSLRRARREGLLLIDTPPVSPADAGGIRALAALLGTLKPDRVIVALPATLGDVAAAQLLQALRPLHAHAVAITHGDETDQLGVAVQAACRFELAPEYLLDRRRGGKELTLIDPSYLANTLLP